MKRIIASLTIVFVVIISANSCKNDNAALLYPPDACDTTNVTYSGTILPIIRDNCYRCHAGSQTVGPFNLDSYADLSIRAANGQLWGAVSHQSGFSPMPKDAPQLSDCNLAKIKKWLDDGYPNN